MAATVMMEPGETLGKYRVLEVVSIGGMAIVYRAEDPELEREVALKVIAPPIADDDAFRRRFRSEGRAGAKLHHPNIVPVHDSGDDQGRLFIVMRFIRGKTLADRMRTDRLTAEQTISLLVPIADAIDAAHAVEIVHRDVKPQNIIVSTDTAHPYLADFGIAKRVATTSFNETSGFIGTLDYAAPEQILGHEVTPATDIYALTAVLYHCLTGRRAYPCETDAAVLHAHVYEPPPTVAADHPGAAVLNALTARGMAKEPGARFASASELMHEASGLVDAWPAISPDMLEPEDGHRASTDGLARNGAAGVRNGSVMPTPSTRDDDKLHKRRPGTNVNPANSADVPNPTPQKRARRGHRLMLGLGVVTALLVAGVVATLLRSQRPTHAPPPPPVARAAPFTFTYKRPWHPVSGPVVGSAALSAGGHSIWHSGTRPLPPGSLRRRRRSRAAFRRRFCTTAGGIRPLTRWSPEALDASTPGRCRAGGWSPMSCRSATATPRPSAGPRGPTRPPYDPAGCSLEPPSCPASRSFRTDPILSLSIRSAPRSSRSPPPGRLWIGLAGRS